MANHFKDYKAKLDEKKRHSITEEDVEVYSKTNNNEGTSHDRKDWYTKPIVNTDHTDDYEEYDETFQHTDKEKTIERDCARKKKLMDVLDSTTSDT